MERVERESLGLRIAYHLDEQSPPRESACLDALEQVALMSLAILADQYLGCCVRQVFDPLLTAEVKLHPDSLVVGVEKAVGVAAEAMHVAIGTRNAALTHDDGDLMQGLGQQRPEVPVVVGAAHTGTRIALDRVVEVRKAQRVTEKEHRRIVAYHIPVAFLGVEFQGEP